MDAQKASYSITLMAKVLGVTRAGYYAWKNRAPQRGKRASARRRLDEAVAWEHEVTGGTYGVPSIHRALQLGAWMWVCVRLPHRCAAWASLG